MNVPDIIRCDIFLQHKRTVALWIPLSSICENDMLRSVLAVSFQGPPLRGSPVAQACLATP